MGKRLLYILLILILGFVANTPSTHAEEKPYWTYQEMQEFIPAVRDEIYNNGCGETWCLYQKWQEVMDRKGKYEATSIYDWRPLTITAFNPSKKTMRITFKKKELDVLNPAPDVEFKIKNLYIARFEPGKTDNSFYEAIESGQGVKEGTHVDVLKQVSDEEAGWISLGEEITLDLMDGDFENTENSFRWFLTSTWGGFGGHYNYDDCLSSPDYHEGMECQIIYYENVASYRPVEIKEEPVLKSSVDVPLDEPAIIEPGVIELKTPDTGVETREESHGVEMPWWIAAFIVAGNVLVVWWFLPPNYFKNRKKSKKVQKRY